MTGHAHEGSHRPHAGWIAMSFLAGLLGGAAAAALLPAAREQPGDATLTIGGLPELDQHVQELTHELQALRAEPMPAALRAEPPAGAAAEPLRPSGGDADLAALVARLDRLLAEPPRLGAPAVPALVIPDPAATEAARRALISAAAEELTPDLSLLSYQQIVERYGRPTRISGGDGPVSWFYDDAATGETRQLMFVDGLVSACY